MSAVSKHLRIPQLRAWSRASAYSPCLLASVALNVVLASYVAASLHARETVQTSNTLPGLFEIIASAEARLPPDDADVLREVYRSREPQLRAAQHAFITFMARAITTIAEPDLDTTALRTAVNDARQQQMQLNDIIVEIFFASLERFSPEARRTLVARYKLR
jgi:uncharacterized membrane protein